MDYLSILGLIQGYAENGIRSLIHSHNWKKLFSETGDFIVQLAEKEGQFLEDLQQVFSDANMQELAKMMNQKSGLGFVDKLHNALYDLFSKYGMEEHAETYINFFLQRTMNYLAEKDPDKYFAAIYSEIEKRKQDKLASIEKKENEILHEIRKLSPESGVFSIENIEDEIKKKTKYHIDLTFFDWDDDQFALKFDSAMDQKREIIVIEGRSKEETLYRTLNYIKHNYSGKQTWVIKNEEDWQNITRAKLANQILIPFFYAESINAIPGNINIFIHDDNIPSRKRDKIQIRRRTKKNIIAAMEAAGISHEEAYTNFEKTHGLYAPIKRILFSQDTYQEPAWKNEDINILLAALFCGKWTQADGDKELLEYLSGKTYEECMTVLKKYERGEDPYIITIADHEETYQIASIEEAWVLLRSQVMNDFIERFITKSIEILLAPDPKADFEAEFEARMRGIRREKWSKSLKKGIIRTFILWTCIDGNARDQRRIDQAVEEILRSVNTREMWEYISEYIVDLCEASPSVVLRRFENELNNPTGMQEIFRDNSGYTSVLWAIEQLIQQDAYVRRAIKWLWEMDSKNYSYQISNSPRSVLEVIFCAWYNATPLDKGSKVNEAEKGIKEYANAWDIISRCLPKENDTIFTTLSKPRYKEIQIPEEDVPTKDIIEIYNAYLKMLIDSANDNAGRWGTILKDLTHFSSETMEKTIEKLVESCLRMSDNEREQIKEEIRKKIYHHRYFHDAKWAMDENEVELFEKYLEKITMDNPIYDYIYLFHSPYDFPLLHPVPNDKEETHDAHDKNEELMQEEISTEIEKFKENHYSVAELIEVAMKQKEKDQVGYIIAHYYDLDQFNESNFVEIIKQNNNSRQIVDYARRTASNIDELMTIIDSAKKNGASEEIISDIIALQEAKTVSDTIIFHETNEIKRTFWTREFRFKISKEAEPKVLEIALEESAKWESIATYIELLYRYEEQLDHEQKLAYFLRIKDIPIKETNRVSTVQWDFGQLLKLLQDRYIEDDEKCFRLAQMEWWAGNMINWDQMQCTRRLVEKDPRVYAGLVNIVCKRDSGATEDPEKRRLATRLYGKFRDIHFCPAEKDGLVEYDDLEKWADEFKKALAEQQQSSLWDMLIGELFPYSPKGKDGYMPCEAVRQFIEKNYTDNLARSYATTIYNMRGVYTPDGGKGEETLASQYEENAKNIEKDAPLTAQIYRIISSDYRMQALQERRLAEDVW